MSPAGKELGATVDRYVTDNNRRGRTALVALLIGVVATGVSVPLVIAQIEGLVRLAGGLTGLLCSAGVVGLWLGITRGFGYFDRRGETFTLCEGGLVHDYAGKTRVIAWDEIAEAEDCGTDSTLNRALGRDVYCPIKLKGGGKVIITGLTQDALLLADAVEQAVHEGIRPSLPGKA